MRYLALASSFDETIASDGQIAPATLAALRRLVASGRQLVLLSRRTVEQLAPGVPARPVRLRGGRARRPAVVAGHRPDQAAGAAAGPPPGPRAGRPRRRATVGRRGGAGDHPGPRCEAIGEPSPLDRGVDLEPGQALAWPRLRGEKPVTFEIAAGATERRPHLRRWAESELDEAKSFWFRGPDKRLNLRAPTLAMFIHLAEGVDDDTWRHHLGRGDYSAWIRAGVRDQTLAGQVAAIEQEAGGKDHPADDSRRRVFAAIRERYAEGRV
jgi:hypothetical protein